MEKNLVILHGWNSRVEKWEPVVKEFNNRGWQVFLTELPGFKSNRLVEPWNLTDYVRWLANFLAINKIQKYCLLGHSFGGSIALKFASATPKGLERLILVASSGVRKKLTVKTLLFFILAKTGKAIFSLPPFCFLKNQAKFLIYFLAREKDYYQAYPVLKKTMKNVLKEDLRPILRKIKTPTLIIWGAKDKITPLKDAFDLQKGIANSKLVYYDGVGHNVPFRKIKELIKEITYFCQ